MIFSKRVQLVIELGKRYGDKNLVDYMNLIHKEIVQLECQSESNRADAERFRTLIRRPDLLFMLWNDFNFDQYDQNLMSHACKLLDNPPEEE